MAVAQPQTREDTLPNEAGCLRLVGAFWARVRDDLRHHTTHGTTRAWIEAEAAGIRSFVWWCGMAGADPAEVRAHLLQPFDH